MTTLSSDRPSTDPNDDLFGHAPFAKSLADCISRYPLGDGIVLSLHGPWGSGKSTVLAYVEHYLEQLPDAERPVVVRFNPWWFSGQENLARAFLGQLQVVLPEKHAGFDKLRDLLADFADGIGAVVDIAAASHGVGGIVGKFLSKLRRRPKDVPALKVAIAKVLTAERKRVLVIVDDIDRLLPEETRQLFTVIKALADFPNVTYLLAFDRDVAVEAINQQTGVPGQQYLEKIIQVPFELPPVEHTALRSVLFARLEGVMADTPQDLLNLDDWTNMFHDGIDSLIRVPRDVVRFINTLAATYPAVLGEVNAVDFIAIEAIRVFVPDLYDVIRRNPGQFTGRHTGVSRGEGDQVRERAFHEAWLAEVPRWWQASSQVLMRRLFPRLRNASYGPEFASAWRRELRACSEDIFPTYFRFAVHPDSIQRLEVNALIAAGESSQSLIEALRRYARAQTRNGLSRLGGLLERLLDHADKDIPAERVSVFVHVLLDIGDELLIDSDERLGRFGIPNVMWTAWLLDALLKRLPLRQRTEVLLSGVRSGVAVGVQRALLAPLDSEGDVVTSTNQESIVVDNETLQELKKLWVSKLRTLRSTAVLLSNPYLPEILDTWKRWGSHEEVAGWCRAATESDDALFEFLRRFLSHSTSNTIGEATVRVHPRLNPTALESYLDIQATADRLATLDARAQVPEAAREAVSQYLLEHRLLHEGRNPEGS